jgi:hypothetical protein
MNHLISSGEQDLTTFTIRGKWDVDTVKTLSIISEGTAKK